MDRAGRVRLRLQLDRRLRRSDRIRGLYFQSSCWDSRSSGRTRPGVEKKRACSLAVMSKATNFEKYRGPESWWLLYHCQVFKRQSFMCIQKRRERFTPAAQCGASDAGVRLRSEER